jgi:hypothetical protein
MRASNASVAAVETANATTSYSSGAVISTPVSTLQQQTVSESATREESTLDDSEMPETTVTNFEISMDSSVSLSDPATNTISNMFDKSSDIPFTSSMSATVEDGTSTLTNDTATLDVSDGSSSALELLYTLQMNESVTQGDDRHTDKATVSGIFTTMRGQSTADDTFSTTAQGNSSTIALFSFEALNAHSMDRTPIDSQATSTPVPEILSNTLAGESSPPTGIISIAIAGDTGSGVFLTPVQHFISPLDFESNVTSISDENVKKSPVDIFMLASSESHIAGLEPSQTSKYIVQAESLVTVTNQENPMMNFTLNQTTEVFTVTRPNSSSFNTSSSATSKSDFQSNRTIHEAPLTVKETPWILAKEISTNSTAENGFPQSITLSASKTDSTSETPPSSESEYDVHISNYTWVQSMTSKSTTISAWAPNESLAKKNRC